MIIETHVTWFEDQAKIVSSSIWGNKLTTRAQLVQIIFLSFVHIRQPWRCIWSGGQNIAMCWCFISNWIDVALWFLPIHGSKIHTVDFLTALLVSTGAYSWNAFVEEGLVVVFVVLKFLSCCTICVTDNCLFLLTFNFKQHLYLLFREKWRFLDLWWLYRG